MIFHFKFYTLGECVTKLHYLASSLNLFTCRVLYTQAMLFERNGTKITLRASLFP